MNSDLSGGAAAATVGSSSGNDCLGIHPPGQGPVTSITLMSADTGSVICGYYNGLLSMRNWNAFSSTSNSVEVAAHRGSVTALATFRKDAPPPQPSSGDSAAAADGAADGGIGAVQFAAPPSAFGGGVSAVDEPVTVVSASSDGEIKAWLMPQGEWMTTLSGHEGAVNTVAVEGPPSSSSKSEAGKQFVFSGGSDGTVRIWDLGAGACLQSLRVHVGRITSVFRPIASALSEEVAASLAGDTVVYTGDKGAKARFFSASDDTLVKLIDPSEKKIINIYKAEHPVTALQLMYPTLFVAATDGTIKGFHAETAAQTVCLQGHKDSVNSLLCHVPYSIPNHSFLVSVSDDLKVLWWNLKTWSITHSFHGHTKSVLCAASDPKSNRILTGGYDTAVRVWDGQSVLDGIMAAEQQAAAEAAAAAAKKKSKKAEEKNPKKRPGARK